jgi:HSP20 family protein
MACTGAKKGDTMHLVRFHPFLSMPAMKDAPQSSWVPAVDVFERQDQLVIRAEVPGLKREDMDVRVENGVLTLHGERKRESEVTEDNAFRMERVYGAFTRSFTLPRTVDASKVSAAYKDGVLEVTVPNLETAKPKKIEINAA